MSLTDKTPVKLPLAVWLVAMMAAATAGIAYNSIKTESGQHTQDIVELKSDAKVQREIVIRIDENVKALVRERRITPHP